MKARPASAAVNRFGAHAFIWAAEWTEEGARTVISGAAEAGLDFVEIPLLRPAEIDPVTTRRMLERHGLGCTCSLGLPADAHLPFAPDRARAFLRDAVDLTEALGGSVLTGALYTHLGTLTRKPPTEEELELVVRVLGEVAAYAAGSGVSLGIEAINRYENYLINTAEQAVEVLDRIDEPNVFVHLDTYHMNIEEKGFRAPIVGLSEHLGYIHLSESDRGTPGSGNVHWDDVFLGLQAIGYRGPLVMESFAAVNEDIIGATAMWRDVIGDPEAMIRDGLGFLRGKASEYLEAAGP